jgi:hypothetical protein
MRPKSRRRFELACGLLFVALLFEFLSNRAPAPPAAQGGMISRTISSIENYPVCQPVIDQIVAIARDENGKMNPNGGQSLAAMDACIAREEKIDITRCPADFRMAESRFLSAERSLSRDAHADIWSEPNVVTRSFFDVYLHRSPYDSLDRMSDKIKSDVDKFQSATFDLIQVASKYDVN